MGFGLRVILWATRGSAIPGFVPRLGAVLRWGLGASCLGAYGSLFILHVFIRSCCVLVLCVGVVGIVLFPVGLLCEFVGVRA